MATEKGGELPVEKFARFKKDHKYWEQEMENYGLTEDEKKIIRKHLTTSHGICESQESLMSLIQEPKIAGWSLKQSDYLRKSIAKKDKKLYEQLTQEFYENAKEKNLSPTITKYFWEVLAKTQAGYSFCAAHCLFYSLIGLQNINLAYRYPIIFWNTANLIVDSSGAEEEEEDEEEIEEVKEEVVDIYEPEDYENYEYIDAPDKKTKVKRAKKATNYGKVASAIGKFKSRGIDVLPPDINESSFTFTPNAEKNSITYGLRGITRVSTEIINQIITNRPYSSFDDFMEKNQTNKLQTINLIKSGAFDGLEGDRTELMRHYIDSITDKKQRLTLQNMPGLIEYDCIPEEKSFYKKLFSFNKFLKKNKEGNDYALNEAAINFIASNFDANYIVNGNSISQKTWDNLYKKAMEPMRDFLKENKEALLNELNQKLFDEEWNKYATGNISKWEMESISFYYHDHELANHSMRLDNFFDLPDEPQIEKTFTTKGGQEIAMYELSLIAGTVIDKNKLKNSISLLTPDGVVNVKIYKNQYSLFDRQVSVRKPDGSKSVLEKSWFQKGTLLLIQGIKRGDAFVPKHYKSSIYPVISRINEVREDGSFDLQFERIEV